MAKKNIVNLTEAAADRIRYLMSQSNSEAVGIRVGVKSGGCSGLAYTFEYVNEKKTADEEVLDKGVRVFIDSKATLYLIGTTLDYIDQKVKSGFVFVNPNEKGKCGCGESFTV